MKKNEETKNVLILFHQMTMPGNYKKSFNHKNYNIKKLHEDIGKALAENGIVFEQKEKTNKDFKDDLGLFREE